MRSESFCSPRQLSMSTSRNALESILGLRMVHVRRVAHIVTLSSDPLDRGYYWVPHVPGSQTTKLCLVH